MHNYNDLTEEEIYLRDLIKDDYISKKDLTIINGVDIFTFTKENNKIKSLSKTINSEVKQNENKE